MIWKENNFLIKKKLEKIKDWLVVGEEICEQKFDPNKYMYI